MKQPNPSATVSDTVSSQQHDQRPLNTKAQQLAPLSGTMCCEHEDLVLLESFFSDNQKPQEIFKWYEISDKQSILKGCLEIHPLLTFNADFLEQVHQWLQNGIAHDGFSKEVFEERTVREL